MMKRGSGRIKSRIRLRPARRSRTSSTRGAGARIILLVGTRKGAFIYHGDLSRRTWRVDGPHFLGHIINHPVLDPRDGRTMLAASRTGHST
jgi:hypothetical protein